MKHLITQSFLPRYVTLRYQGQTTFPRISSPDFSPFKLECLKDTFRHAFEATHPCAFAYSYARIRRLVRLGVGFYCGSVADESAIGFRSPDQSRRTALQFIAIND
jgi:hypothetical protein